MNVFSSYKSFVSNPYSYDWIYFLEYYADKILDSDEFNNFIEKFPFPVFQTEDFPCLFKESLVQELYFWPYKKLHIDKTSLCESIVTSSKDILVNLMAAYNSFEKSEIIIDDNSNLMDEDIIKQHYEIRKTIKAAELELLNAASLFKTLENLILGWRGYSSFSIIRPSKVEKKQIIENPQPSIIQSIDLIDLSTYKLIISNPDLLKTMDWRLFEELLADILKTFNYQIELTQATKDGGIDIIALKQDSEFGIHKYLLQAKRYSHNVGIEPVQRLLFHHQDQKPSKVCLATTANFTKGAWELAKKYLWQLELKDMQGILGWVNRAAELKIKR
ncbi:hypothetical protein GCM10027275_05990 [Rhabdobacter roseus]|uniref:Restriction endonuclease type IV Mrr domain-containing protein n=1 Tax=Rhabdobacter roseus TaxID=1655419 RepID=A0A840TGY3_9BACT|nr:restriction endonuclease [Rhabdobacter roseus]MBB5282491.1 hypothetical protein [Rhabdobacter roseus]